MNVDEALSVEAEPVAPVSVTVYYYLMAPERLKSSEFAKVNVIDVSSKLRRDDSDGKVASNEYVMLHQSRVEAKSGTSYLIASPVIVYV